jgi:hypothetical protein
LEYEILTNGSGRNINYLISEYILPRNIERNYSNRSNRNGVSDAHTRNILENFLQPIEIYPTQSQIETATRRARYCDISRPINTSCPISMDEFSDNDMVTMIRHCGHIFHTEHIMNWFRNHCRCPVCRYDIREYNTDVTNQFFNNSQDSSNNNVDANNNNNNNRNVVLHGENLNDIISNSLESLEYLLNTNTSVPSSNYSSNQIDPFTTFLINVLNRNQNTR